MAEFKKVNFKNLILLLISVILAVAVCCAAAYAWFMESTSATGTVSLGVNKYHFSTNGNDVTSEEFTITPSNTSMYPGQSFTAELTFTNVGSDMDSVYSVQVIAVNAPPNMDWTYGTNSSNPAGNAVKTVAVNSYLVQDRTLSKGSTEKFIFYGKWQAVDKPTVNAQDIQWGNDNKSKGLYVTLRVTSKAK